VAAGRAPAGTLLPPVRALAADLGVSAGTVAAAYRLLTERGVVEGHRRAGTRVRSRPKAAWRPVAPPPPGTRDLASGNPDPALLPTVRFGAGSPRLYRGPAVLPELAEQARAAFAADGIEPPALTVTSGALDAVERALTAHVRPGMRVAVEDPGYAGLLDLVAALGLVIEPVAVDGDGMRPGGLAAALERGAQAVILTPRAQNPTGAALTPARAEALAAVLAGRADVLLVEDDHAGAVAGVDCITVAGSGRLARWVIARSCSKGLGPDLRLALVAGDAATIAAVEARQAVGPGWVSHLLQGAVAWLLGDPGTAGLLAAAAAAYEDRRQALVGALGARGIEAWGRSGLNVWIPVPEEGAVVAGMAARGWAVAAGARFRSASPPGVRVTTATLQPAGAEEVAADLAASLGAPGRTRAG